MVSVIQEVRKPSFSEKLGEGFSRFGQASASALSEGLKGREENKRLKELIGHDVSGLSPDMKKLFVQGTLRKKEDKEIAKQQTYQSLLGTIDDLEGLLDQPGIGLLGNLNPTDEARFNRGRLRTLNASLLNYYKSLFPRGFTQEEFKRIEKNYILGDYDTIETMRGKLRGFRDEIQKKLQEGNSIEEGEEEKKKPEKKSKGKKTKFNIQNPEHKKKRDQVLKDAKGDRAAAEKILLREFEL